MKFVQLCLLEYDVIINTNSRVVREITVTLYAAVM